MSRKLDEVLSTYAYDTRQKNQLRMADEKGLNLDMMKNPLYDWEQMREIALAMEYGLDPSPLCDPTISSESMGISEFICLKIRVCLKMPKLKYL